MYSNEVKQYICELNNNRELTDSEYVLKRKSYLKQKAKSYKRLDGFFYVFCEDEYYAHNDYVVFSLDKAKEVIDNLIENRNLHIETLYLSPAAINEDGVIVGLGEYDAKEIVYDRSYHYDI